MSVHFGAIIRNPGEENFCLYSSGAIIELRPGKTPLNRERGDFSVVEVYNGTLTLERVP